MGDSLDEASGPSIPSPSRLEHDNAPRYFGDAAALKAVFDPRVGTLQLNGGGRTILGHEEAASVRKFFDGLAPSGRESGEGRMPSAVAIDRVFGRVYPPRIL